MDSSSERSKLLARDAEWAALASEGRDLERILSYWAEDAVVIPPGMAAVHGKAALREYVRASLQIPGFSITWSTNDAVVSPDGRLAYLLSENVVTMNGPDGSPVHIRGRAVTVWRKDMDGQWRCVVDVWNDAPKEKP